MPPKWEPAAEDRLWDDLGAASAAVFASGMLAQQRIGGYTGDVLGAFQQIGEIVMLLTAAAR